MRNVRWVLGAAALAAAEDSKGRTGVLELEEGLLGLYDLLDLLKNASVLFWV